MRHIIHATSEILHENYIEQTKNGEKLTVLGY